MTMSVIFCLSYDLSKELFIAIKVDIISSFCQIYRVTDKALIAETMIWPNFFFMNVFFALKGYKLFIIIVSTKNALFSRTSS